MLPLRTARGPLKSHFIIRSYGFNRPRNFSSEAASHPSNKTQVYISKSRDPLLNLSIEHNLLQKSPPDSTILLLYVNAPCVVFGRNQNPWLEANLPRLAQIARRPGSLGWTDGPVRLVRRRSGGGTVFHDGGNVNFSVICPSGVFDRDRYAEMVVRALASLGRRDARVNERHDIVVDVTPGATDDAAAGTSTFKISGSAYKLTRLRSLHHGTCLLNSPNLSNISGMLRSPAAGFIKARGVDSVRSPVRNVDVDNEAFIDAVVDEFSRMRGPFDIRGKIEDREGALEGKVLDGYKELQSRDWVYGQTPRFTFCTHPSEEDPRPRESLPFDIKLHFEARHGIVEKFNVDGMRGGTAALVEGTFVGSKLCDVHDWTAWLGEAGMDGTSAGEVGGWMNGVMGTEFTREVR